jgi:hypothetical protein
MGTLPRREVPQQRNMWIPYNSAGCETVTGSTVAEAEVLGTGCESAAAEVSSEDDARHEDLGAALTE